jgi:hypothetical protein
MSKNMNNLFIHYISRWFSLGVRCSKYLTQAGTCSDLTINSVRDISFWHGTDTLTELKVRCERKAGRVISQSAKDSLSWMTALLDIQ